MHIHELALDDIPALLEIGNREDGFRVSEESAGFWSHEQLTRWISADEDVLLGAKINGELVGYVLTTHHVPTGKVTWENIVVLPEYRDLGIGEALVLEMRERLKTNGATYLHFLVKTDNSSLPFFEQAGFSRGFDFVWFDQQL